VAGLPVERDIFIRVFAMDGKLLLQDKLSLARVFSLENYPLGSYIVVFENEKKQAVKAVELILQR